MAKVNRAKNPRTKSRVNIFRSVGLLLSWFLGISILQYSTSQTIFQLIVFIMTLHQVWAELNEAMSYGRKLCGQASR